MELDSVQGQAAYSQHFLGQRPSRTL